MTLTPVLATDAPALAALHAAAFETPWSAREIAGLLGGPGAFGFAAETMGVPAGFILCRSGADEAEILTLAVAPDHRRRGVARDLLAAAIEAATASGAAALFLEVAADGAAAIALYHGAGFRQVGVRPRYYARARGAADALVFRRDLAG